MMTTDSSAEHLCEVCRQRLDAVLWAVGKHPNCGPYEPLTDAGYDRLVAHLIHSLGATEIEATEGIARYYHRARTTPAEEGCHSVRAGRK